MTPPETPRPPRVFASYSHDSPAHMDRVLDLCDRLRHDGVDAEIDQYEGAPREGWPRWTARQIEAADFVLVVCTAAYCRRFDGTEESGRGLGARWEGAVLSQVLYDSGAVSGKLIPILFAADDEAHVPTLLRGLNHFNVGADGGYEKLYRLLTDQPAVPRPQLGALLALPARPRAAAELLGIETVDARGAAALPSKSHPAGRREPVAGEERLHPQDRTVLLYVPGGEYLLGAKDISKNEKPVHRVVLSPFWIAKYPVTNEQYARFREAQPDSRPPAYWGDKRFNQPNQPVVRVSWDEAQAYCRWAGLRLPSEAQWEAAARGADGRRFPWGDEEPTPERASFGGREGATTPVGAYPRGAGPFGALDQAGNVWEWCEDAWDAAAYKTRDGAKDPVVLTSEESAVRCLRGGSWSDSAWHRAAACRYGNRSSFRYRYIGFRCLLPARPEP